LNWKEIMDRACELIKEYNEESIRPTVRQIHYRLASEQVGGYQNNKRCYKSLSEKLVKARMKGLIDWGGLADHVRYMLWTRLVPTVGELIEQATSSFGEDPWDAMGKRVVVWLEKDALAELIYHVVAGYYVPLAVSRGYSSWTFIYDNLDILKSVLEVKVFYLGDHDPSGLDIERFTKEAMRYFGINLELRRVALTYEQIQRYNLLPNPTKRADPRSKEYIIKYGDVCWELDALEPKTLQQIVRSAVESEIEPSIWNKIMDKNRRAREKLKEELRKRLLSN